MSTNSRVARQRRHRRRRPRGGVAGETGSTAGSVSTWTDKSGRNNHTSAPGQAPTASAQTMNGLPVITFNGTTILQGTPAARPVRHIRRPDHVRRHPPPLGHTHEDHRPGARRHTAVRHHRLQPR
ncbi:MAG: hypothetical protein R2713_15560 [Ilumatobacteraceae bacterium]